MDHSNFYDSERYQEQYGQRESLGAYTARTFLWMFLGLLVSFGVALGGYLTGVIVYVFAIPYFHIVLLVDSWSSSVTSTPFTDSKYSISGILFFRYI